MESVCMNLNFQSKIFGLTWRLFALCFLCTTIFPAFVCLVLLFGISGCSSASMGPSSPPPKSPNISISPTSAVVGSVDVTLTVTGSAFSNAPHNLSAVVFSVNGSDTKLATTLISSTQLTAIVPANLMVNPVTAEIFVETGDPMGSIPLAKSDEVAFSVKATSGALTTSSVSPASALAGSPDLTITVTGTGFVDETHDKTFVVFVANGTANYLTTTFVNSTQVTAVIPAALMASPISGNIHVETGDPLASFTSSTSNSIPFNVKSQ